MRLRLRCRAVLVANRYSLAQRISVNLAQPHAVVLDVQRLDALTRRRAHLHAQVGVLRQLADGVGNRIDVVGRYKEPLRAVLHAMREMRELFPEAELHIEWWFGLPKSLIA